MEEIWKDRASFDAWCAEFAEDLKVEVDDDGNNSAYERESDSGLVPAGREVVAVARGDLKPSRWPRLMLAVALALAGAVLAAALGHVCAQQLGLAGWASSGSAGGTAVVGQPDASGPQLRGAAEAAVGAHGAPAPRAQAKRDFAAHGGAGAAAASDEVRSGSAKTLEENSDRGDGAESMPENILESVTAEGSWDKEPAAASSVSDNGNVTVAAELYD